MSLNSAHGKIIIETPRLIIREFTPHDELALFELFSDFDVMYFCVWGPLDLKGTRAFIKKTVENYKNKGFGKWAVILKKTGKLIGSCGFHTVKIDRDSIIELEYRLQKKLWGRGIGTEAAIACRDYGFTNLNLSEIFSGMDPNNIASMRVAEKTGMRFLRIGNFFNKKC